MFRLTVFFLVDSVEGSASLKAVVQQITQNVSAFIYFALKRKNTICS